MAEATGFTPIPRVPTGVPGLDTVLRGGLLRGGLYILLGAPGAGKTIVANQIAFQHVAAGGRAVYVTLLAESHARMLAHMQSLSFFDPAPLTHALYYISGYNTLREEGLRGLLQLIRQAVRDRRATLLAVDGMITAEQVAGSEVDYKQFIHELHTFIEAVDCTTLLLSHGGQRDEASAVHTMADGIIELRDTIVGLRAVRELLVRKYRGSDYLRGLHTFDITDAGVTVHPRAEAQLSRAPAAVHTEVRRPFGVENLDAMLGGGLPDRSATMVLGPPGSGKTLLGLHFLAANAAAGEPGVLMSFSETADDIAGLLAGLGLGGVRAGEPIEVLWQPPLEDTLDTIAERLLAAVERRGATRLFIDGLHGLLAAATYPERIGAFMPALLHELRARGVTTVISVETPRLTDPTEHASRLGISPLMDNILLLRYEEGGRQLRRTLSVIKARRSAFEPAARTFRITSGGLIVDAADDGTETPLRDR